MGVFSYPVSHLRHSVNIKTQNERFHFCQNLTSDIITARILFQDLPPVFSLSTVFSTKIKIVMLNLVLAKEALLALAEETTFLLFK